MHANVAVLISVFLLSSSHAAGQPNADQGQPRWAVKESFALRAESENGRYTVITFIPRSFLLYDIDFTEPDSSAGQAYAAATTQDGARILILEDTISKNILDPTAGERLVIFNASVGICEVPNCDTQDEDDLLPVAAGERFSAEDVGGELLQLTGDRNGEIITGYISEARVKSLEQEAIVTDPALPLPRLTIARASARLPSLGCGEVRTANDELTLNQFDEQGSESISEADRVTFEHFDLGNISPLNDEFRVQFTKAYGSADEAHEYRTYTVVDNWDNSTRIFAAQIVYRCAGTAPNRTPRVITAVSLKDQDGTPIEFTPLGAPDNLIDRTAAPYLWSINNERQYRDIMTILASKLENRALAGYFVTEFNRSCRKRDRGSNDCQKIQYPS